MAVADINLGSLTSRAELDIAGFQRNIQVAQAALAGLRTNLQGMATAARQPFAQLSQQTGQAFQTMAQGVQRSLSSLGSQLKTAGANLQSVGRGLALGVTAPIVGMGTSVLRSSIQFEDAFTGIKRTVEGTPEQFATLRASILALSQQIPVTANQLAAIGEIGGQMNIPPEALMPYIKTVALLGSTSKLSFEEAGTTLGKFASIMGTTPANFERFASTLSRLGDMSVGDERAVAALAQRLVGAGRMARMTEADVLGLAAGFTQLGLEPEMAGTAVSRAILEMGKAVATGGTELQYFATVAGLSAQQFAQAWQTNAAGALILFTEGLGKLSTQGVNVEPALEALGLDAMRTGDAMRRAAVSGDVMRNFLAAARLEMETNIKIQQEAALRFGTTSSQMQVAANKASVIAIALGDQLKPMLLEVLNGLLPFLEKLRDLVTWFSTLDPHTKTTIVSLTLLAAALGPLVIVLGTVLSSLGSLVTLLAGAGGVAVAVGGLLAVLTGPAGLAVGFGVVLVAGIIAAMTSLRGFQHELVQAQLRAAEFQGQVAKLNTAAPGAGEALQKLDAQIKQTFDPAAKKKLEETRDALLKGVQATAEPLVPGKELKVTLPTGAFGGTPTPPKAALNPKPVPVATQAPRMPVIPDEAAEKAASKAARERYQTAKQEVQNLLQSQRDTLELQQREQEIGLEQVRQQHDSVALAQAEGTARLASLTLQRTQLDEAIAKTAALRALATKPHEVADITGEVARLQMQREQLALQERFTTLQMQGANAEATRQQALDRVGASLSFVTAAYQGQADVVQAQSRTALELLEQQQAAELHTLEVRGASERTLEVTRYQQALILSQQRYAVERQLYEIRLQMANAEVANLTEQQQLAVTDQDRLRIAGDLLRKNYELQALQVGAPVQAQVLDNLYKVPGELEKTALEAVQDILQAFTSGSMNLGSLLSRVGSTFLKPFVDGLGGSLKDLTTGLFGTLSEGTQRLISGGVGVALTAVSTLFNQQSAKVESLGESVKSNIESVEKQRGLIAGDQSIAIAQLSDQLGAAFRPTNAILTRIEAVLRAGMLGGVAGPLTPATATPYDYYGAEVLGSVRLG
mgnify:CR=1 FL=1